LDGTSAVGIHLKTAMYANSRFGERFALAEMDEIEPKRLDEYLESKDFDEHKTCHSA
jgi:hypothetical protein